MIDTPSSRFDGIQRLLSEYVLKATICPTDDDLLCLICRRLMVDACQTLCGCQYCHGCIKAYLVAGNAFCPGGKADCYEVRLDLERDVFRNGRLNMRISRVEVTCPKEGCASMVPLCDLEEHMRVCSKEAPQCIFSQVGCVGHCLSEEAPLGTIHGPLLVSFMNNLRNELHSLRETVEFVKSEVVFLREEVSNRLSQMKALLRSEEGDGLSERSAFKENIIAMMDHELRELRAEMGVMLGTFREEAETRETQMKAHFKQAEDVNKRIAELCERYHEDTERKITNMIRMNKLSPNVDIDFVWKVEDYSKKRRTVTDIYSEAFYAYNYKMCLNLYVYGENVGLWCVLMRGEHDDLVQWPMRRTVTLAIMDQDNMRPHNSIAFQYDNYQRNKTAFDRPKADRNEYRIGTDSFTRYSAIRDCPTVLAGDSFVVSCVIR